MATKPPSKKNQKLIDDFNRLNPVGSIVYVRKDSGERIRGATLSPAWILCGEPVLNVEGVAGPYLLERITPEKRDGLNQPIVADDLYYLQDSRSYVGNCVLWWRPQGAGYTCDIEDAGTYLGKDVMGYRDTDVPWPIGYVGKHITRVVDWQRLRPAPPRETKPALSEG